MKTVYDVQLTFYDTRKLMPDYCVIKLYASGETISDLYIGVTKVALEVMETHDYLLLKEITILD